MILFADTDILLKLGSLDLFEEALEVLGVSEEDVRVLPNAKYYVRNRTTKLIPTYGKVGVQRTLRFVERVKSFTEAPEAGEYKRLLDAGLDVGEASIFAATAKEADFSVFTGDAKAQII